MDDGSELPQILPSKVSLHHFDVLNKFQPSGINSMEDFEQEMMRSDFELANGGIFFIEDADKLTKSEINYLLSELKRNDSFF